MPPPPPVGVVTLVVADTGVIEPKPPMGTLPATGGLVVLVDVGTLSPVIPPTPADIIEGGVYDATGVGLVILLGAGAGAGAGATGFATTCAGESEAGLVGASVLNALRNFPLAFSRLIFFSVIIPVPTKLPIG